MKLHVRWTVTEVHSAAVEVEDYDPENPEEALDDTVLADAEDATSYDFTEDRTILEVVEA